MSSLSRNERVELHPSEVLHPSNASKRRKTCGVLKFPISNFNNFSREELNIHIKKKHYSCQEYFNHGDEKHAQQLSKTLIYWAG